MVEEEGGGAVEGKDGGDGPQVGAVKTSYELAFSGILRAHVGSLPPVQSRILRALL